MDLNALSRRELQALCKSNGIPANKTNVFMVDALTKKRIPLSKMDTNRNQKTANSIGSAALKSPPLAARKKKTSDVNSAGTVQQKPPLFQNNFLRRGKRKDAPTSYEGDAADEKAKVQSISESERPHHMGTTKTSTIVAAQPFRTDQMVSTKVKADSGLSGLTSETLSGTATRHSKVESRLKSGDRSGIAAKGANVITSSATSSDDSTSDGSKNAAKGKIEDRIRSQIDAALCSKVMKASELRPSAVLASLESSERALESDEKVDTVDRSQHLNLPLAGPEQQGDSLQVNLANSEALRLPLESPEQQTENLSFPQSLVCQTGTREPTALTSTPATNAERPAWLEVITPSPPVSFSPLVRVEEKVRSIVERVQKFWKGTKELAVANTFGSPVQ